MFFSICMNVFGCALCWHICYHNRTFKFHLTGFQANSFSHCFTCKFCNVYFCLFMWKSLTLQWQWFLFLVLVLCAIFFMEFPIYFASPSIHQSSCDIVILKFRLVLDFLFFLNYLLFFFICRYVFLLLFQIFILSISSF